MKSHDPETDAEWQEAVDLAEFYLHLESAKQYGLVAGGPQKVHLERCDELLKRGSERGITPRPDAVERCLAAYNSSR